MEETLVNRRTRSLLPVPVKSLSGIQGVRVAPVEGVKINYNDKDKN